MKSAVYQISRISNRPDTKYNRYQIGQILKRPDIKSAGYQISRISNRPDTKYNRYQIGQILNRPDIKFRPQSISLKGFLTSAKGDLFARSFLECDNLEFRRKVPLK